MTDTDRADRSRRDTVVIAGHAGDTATIRDHVDDPSPSVRAAALRALARAGDLADNDLSTAMSDVDPGVRRVAVELAASHPNVDLTNALSDVDPTVIEMAAWAAGEIERVDEHVLDRLIHLAVNSDEQLIRESSAAALGAIGDPRGLPAILAACADKPHVRRRAVLALAPFEGDEVDAAIERALTDRDWQVRQAAEDLQRAAGIVDLDADDPGPA